MKPASSTVKGNGFVLKDIPTLAKRLKEIEESSKVITPLSWFNLPRNHPLTGFLIGNGLVNTHYHIYTTHISMQLNTQGLSVHGTSRKED